jgi:hypothetical protein
VILKLILRLLLKNFYYILFKKQSQTDLIIEVAHPIISESYGEKFIAHGSDYMVTLHPKRPNLFSIIYGYIFPLIFIT